MTAVARGIGRARDETAEQREKKSGSGGANSPCRHRPNATGGGHRSATGPTSITREADWAAVAACWLSASGPVATNWVRNGAYRHTPQATPIRTRRTRIAFAGSSCVHQPTRRHSGAPWSEAAKGSW